MKVGDKVSGHFCWNCLTQVDWAMRTKDNPAKTDWCKMCDHKAEGLNSTAEVGNWLKLGKSRSL